jgi:simple sugar transport system substrate-binding protein
VVIETAERRGIFSTGYHANQAELAPQGYLTGAEWDWSNVYTNYITLMQEGKTLMDGGIPHLVRGGFQDGFLKLSPFGSAVNATAQQAAEAAQAQLMSGELVIYKGEIKDNQGKTVVPGDKELGQTAVELEQMNWLAEGVMGSVG